MKSFTTLCRADFMFVVYFSYRLSCCSLGQIFYASTIEPAIVKLKVVTLRKQFMSQEPTVNVLIVFFSAKLEINIEKAFALVVCAYVEL